MSVVVDVCDYAFGMNLYGDVFVNACSWIWVFFFVLVSVHVDGFVDASVVSVVVFGWWQALPSVLLSLPLMSLPIYF